MIFAENGMVQLVLIFAEIGQHVYNDLLSYRSVAGLLQDKGTRRYCSIVVGFTMTIYHAHMMTRLKVTLKKLLPMPWGFR